jgi:hypothetical protein
MCLQLRQPHAFVDKFCFHVLHVTHFLAISAPIRKLGTLSRVQVRCFCRHRYVIRLPYGLAKVWMTKRICFYISTYHMRCLSPQNCLLHTLLRDLKSSCRYFEGFRFEDEGDEDNDGITFTRNVNNNYPTTQRRILKDLNSRNLLLTR